MRVLILNALVPFVYGGAEYLAEELAQKLREHGHEAQLVRVPFAWGGPSQVAECMLAARLSIADNTDKVIALKFPVYYTEFPNKSVWLVHQFRQAYDFMGTPFTMFTPDHESESVRQSVIRADNAFLSPVAERERLFTISHIVTQRLKTYNGIDSRVLYPPLMNAGIYHAGETGDYLFYPSRVNRSKRQTLAVEAMRHVKSGAKLVLAGKGDSERDENDVQERIEAYGLQDKVAYLNRFITEEEKADLMANALGCLFIPDNEDYGYVTLEAFYSGKPVITAKDAGCPVYFVEESQAGYVAEPSPEALAASIDQLYGNKKRAEEMGKNGLPLIEKLGMNWDNVVESLLR